MSADTEIKKVTLDELDNTELVRAMKDVKAKKSSAAEAAFISILKKATLLTPAMVADNDGKSKTHISFITFKDSDNRPLLPAFSSREELAKYSHEEKLQTIVCHLEQYIDMITSEGGPYALVIDPFGENIIISREILKKIKNGEEYSANDNEDNNKIRIADLKEQPKELVNILKEFFDEEGTVKQAYLQAMKKGDSTGFVLVVDDSFPKVASKEEHDRLRKDLFDRIAERVKPSFLTEEYAGLDFSITEYASDLGREIAEGREAFYIKR